MENRETTTHPSKEALYKCLDNLTIVVSKYKIMNGDFPLTGAEFSQLFQDLNTLYTAVNELHELKTPKEEGS